MTVTVMAMFVLLIIAILKRKNYFKLVVATFPLIMYTTMMMLVTLLTRKDYYEHSFDPMGGWSTTIKYRYMLIHEWLENIILFVPFALSLTFALWILNRKVNTKIVIGVCACVSLSIEIIQLISHRGTFQIADLVYNIIGSVIGMVMILLPLEICKK